MNEFHRLRTSAKVSKHHRKVKGISFANKLEAIMSSFIHRIYGIPALADVEQHEDTGNAGMLYERRSDSL